MVAPIPPNAENCSCAELETAMRAAPRQPAFVRMKAIHTMLRGFDHATVAGVFNVTRATLNRWIKNFNSRGIDGLIDVLQVHVYGDSRPGLGEVQEVIVAVVIRHDIGAAGIQAVGVVSGRPGGGIS